jgi:hypothetical protein
MFIRPSPISLVCTHLLSGKIVNKAMVFGLFALMLITGVSLASNCFGIDPAICPEPTCTKGSLLSCADGETCTDIEAGCIIMILVSPLFFGTRMPFTL